MTFHPPWDFIPASAQVNLRDLLGEAGGFTAASPMARPSVTGMARLQPPSTTCYAEHIEFSLIKPIASSAAPDLPYMATRLSQNITCSSPPRPP